MYTGRGGSHTLSDICHARIVQRRSGGSVLTMDCRGYGTASRSGIPLDSRCGNASLSRGKLTISPRTRLLSFLNHSYDSSFVRVRALGRHSLI